MSSEFWEVLLIYKINGNQKASKEFIDDYHVIWKLVHNKMYSREVDDMFCGYVGADDGHDDLIDYIIWHGKGCVDKFLQDPSSVIPLAKNMRKHYGFDGDINILQKIIY